MRRFNCSLNKHGSLERAIDDLKQYKVELQNKCIIFVSELAKIGIETGKANCGEYGSVIAFTRKAEITPTGAKATLLATGTPIVRQRKGQTIEANPLLLAEFGSGWQAEVLQYMVPLQVGQGTFPGQTHAFDPNGWYYWDEAQQEWVHTMGESPTFPMYSAMMSMIFAVNETAKRVFRS